MSQLVDPRTQLVSGGKVVYLEFDSDTSILLSVGRNCFSQSQWLYRRALSSIVFPVASPQSWWEYSEKSLLWWQQWYAEYERFIMSYSQFANVNGIDQLILGGSGVESSLPGAIKTSGMNFGTPKTAEQLWTDLLKKVNTYYTGQLLFSIPADDGNLATFSFFDQVDGFYLTLSDQDLQAYGYDQYSVGTYLDGSLYAFYQS